MNLSRRTALALAFTLGFLFILSALLFHDQPPNNRDILNVLLGGFLMLLRDIVRHEFPNKDEEQPKVTP